MLKHIQISQHFLDRDSALISYTRWARPWLGDKHQGHRLHHTSCRDAHIKKKKLLPLFWSGLETTVMIRRESVFPMGVLSMGASCR